MILYERYFDIIPSYYDLNQLGQAGSVSETAGLLFSPFDLLFFVDFIVYLYLIVSKKVSVKNITLLNWKLSAGVIAVMLVLSGTLFYVNRDEPFFESGLYAKENGLINAQFLQAYNRASAESLNNQLSYEEILALKGNEFVPYEENELFGVAKDRHLIVIQVESLQDFVIDMELNGEEITPFMNDLVKDSLYFDEVYQQIGSGNTSDAEVLMNMSVYPSGLEPTVNSIDKSDKVPSLPRLLDVYGYHSSTYHADEVTYWNRNNLYPAIGYDEYYDTAYYGEEDVIGFGPSDGLFFEKTLDVFDDLLETEEKLYANVMTITSHSPFEMPEDRSYLDLPEEFEGTLIGNYLQSVKYVDTELEKFVQGLKDRGIWDNSVIAIFGDHSGVHGELVKDEDVAALKGYFGRNYSLVDRFNIPFIVTVPGAVEGETVSTVGGQIDMMPTLLNLLGVEPMNMTIFGHNLYEYDNNLLGMRYYLPNGSFINDDVMFSEQSAKRDRRMWRLDTSEAYTAEEIEYSLENDFEGHQEKVLQLMEASDQYMNHLLQNKEEE
ncbi:sulfatase [Jeotgalibacillus malaysiensis]|uniref:Sulfatase n=1 Tax=Jeotgalibacillus malaysiensis TaxID=1508404 RepID=A0A0B5APX5_9BACL|nr:sulfatase [Jeotgalibacillus malaysiensis]